MVHGCRSKLVNVWSGLSQGSVLGPLLFLLYTSELFSILENKLIGYSDDSTLMDVVPSPGVKVTVAESSIHDLGRVISEWCDLSGMKFNAIKTKTMMVSRSRIIHPSHPHELLTELYWRNLMTLLYWSDIWFQEDFWGASTLGFQSSFSKTCILKSWRVSHERSLLGRCFRCFVLSGLEYCSAVWCSAADARRKLLDRAVSGSRFLTMGVTLLIVDPWQYCVCCIRSCVIRCTL